MRYLICISQGISQNLTCDACLIIISNRGSSLLHQPKKSNYYNQEWVYISSNFPTTWWTQYSRAEIILISKVFKKTKIKLFQKRMDHIVERPTKYSVQLGILQRSLELMLVKDLHTFQVTHRVVPSHFNEQLPHGNAVVSLKSKFLIFQINEQRYDRFWNRENPKLFTSNRTYPRCYNMVWC